MVAPHSVTLSLPPSRMALTASRGSLPLGNVSRFMASFGSPPIAYTSLSELAAAIWPNIYGSSTIGGKKSTVLMIATSSDTL